MANKHGKGLTPSHHTLDGKILIFLNEKFEELNDGEDLIVDFKELEKFDQDLADKLVNNPSHITKLFNKYLNRKKPSNSKVRFINLNITPLRKALSKDIGQLISTKGVVKALGEIQPQLIMGYFECKNCNSSQTIPQKENKVKFPEQCYECGGEEFELIKNKSTYIDKRLMVLEEPISDLKSNQPRRMNVRLQNNLIYSADTGNNIELSGILDEDTTKQKFIINANSINNIDDSTITLNEEDIKKIEKLSQKDNIINLLIKSLAPNLILPEIIKKGALCYLVKGAEPTEANERDTIHILLISDPGTAKSALAQALKDLSEKVIEADGTGSSGVGLTGSVVKNSSQEYVVEAGAIALANKGHLIIDEFDKLDVSEQKKLLKAMEQGTVEINKAGLNQTLETNTSVLALANPTDGRFDQSINVKSQVHVYAPLLSRFDLLFILEDKPNTSKDSEIASAIINKYSVNKDENDNLISENLLQKYIKFARDKKPVLSTESKQTLKDFYVNTRNNNDKNNKLSYIDARSLNAVIRLAGAIAKLKLKNTIDKEDVEEAIDLKIKSLESTGFDAETGKIDMDKATGNISETERIECSKIMDLLKDYLNTKDKNNISIRTLKEKVMKERNLNKKEVDYLLNHLQKIGSIQIDNQKVYLNNDPLLI